MKRVRTKKMGIYGVWLFELPPCWEEKKCVPFPPKGAKMITMIGTRGNATKKDIDEFAKRYKVRIDEIKKRGNIAVVMGGQGDKCYLMRC